MSWSQLPGTATLTTGSGAGADCAAARSDSKSASSGGASACAAASTPGTASTSTHFCAKNPPTPPCGPSTDLDGDGVLAELLLDLREQLGEGTAAEGALLDGGAS